MKFDTGNPKHQHALRAFVQREVIYCVSQLVSEVSKDFDDETSYEIMWRYDWEGAAYDEGWRLDEGERMTFRNGDQTFESDADDTESAWIELCESESIEPHTIEALEHWIVSDYLACELEARGEMISHDFYGLTIWGRTTTGQSVYIDQVIAGIASDFPNDHWTCELARNEAQ